MLLFSKVLSIKKTLTKEKFIDLVRAWNENNNYKDNVIPGIENWDVKKEARFGNDALWIEMKEYSSKNIIAFRYEKINETKGETWDTDYIMNFDEMKLSIQLERSYTEDSLKFDPEFSTPLFISHLIEGDYLMEDGKLAVKKRPHIVTEENVDLLSDVVNGEVKYQLPIVYVSKTVSNTDPVAVNLLASRLKGVAHVLLESDKSLDELYSQACSDKNAKNGDIDIYYPNSIESKRYYYRREEGEDASLFRKVIGKINEYCCLQKVDELCTWQGVRNALLLENIAIQREEKLAAEKAKARIENEKTKIEVERNRIKNEKNQIEDEKNRIEIEKNKIENEKNRIEDERDSYAEVFDEELEQLTKENLTLRAENAALQEQLKGSGVPVLKFGDEIDFYPGEIKDIILSALSEYLKNTGANTRRAHVIDDVIKANNYQHLSEKRRETIKNLLVGYKSLSGVMKQELADMGIKLTSDGNHNKLTYCDDNRYMVTMSKTSSDGARAGKNAASEICNLMF